MIGDCRATADHVHAEWLATLDAPVILDSTNDERACKSGVFLGECTSQGEYESYNGSAVTEGFRKPTLYDTRT